MPMKKYGARRTRKPTMKKVKSMVTKLHKKKAQKNMDTFFLRAKEVSTIIPGQGALVANYIYWACTLDPTAPTGAGGFNSFLANAEFNLYRQIYDKFRINSVHVRVIPKANVIDMVQAQNDTSYNTTGDGCIHTCVDRDGIAVSNIAAISRYPSYKKYSLLKPWSRSYSVKYPTGIWLDCQSPATFSMAKELGLQGGVTFYAENLLEDNNEIWNEPYAQVETYYNIVFQGKTSASIKPVTDGTSGAIIGVQLINPEGVEPNRPLTVPRSVRGTLVSDTRLVGQQSSNNEISITDVGTA